MEWITWLFGNSEAVVSCISVTDLTARNGKTKLEDALDVLKKIGVKLVVDDYNVLKHMNLEEYAYNVANYESM